MPLTTARRSPRRPLQRRRRRIPPGPYRRLMSPRPSHAVEQYFLLCLTRVAAAFAKAVGPVVLPAAKKIGLPDVTKRTDASDDDDDEDLDEDETEDDGLTQAEIDDLVRRARDAAEEARDDDDIEKSSETASKRAVLHSQKEFERIGLRLPKHSAEPKLKWLADGWRRDNVARIKGMQSSQLDKIERLLRDGQGMRHETLAKELERQLKDVTVSRCERIARSQTLRLNGQITRERQTAYGIEKFIWSTSQDERVREEHAVLEGEEFTWEDGDPEEGFPGDAEQCRCTAFPVLPELDDDDTEDDDA